MKHYLVAMPVRRHVDQPSGPRWRRIDEKMFQQRLIAFQQLLHVFQLDRIVHPYVLKTLLRKERFAKSPVDWQITKSHGPAVRLTGITCPLLLFTTRIQ
jgi:hypothetical protein